MSESWDDYAATWDEGAPALYADEAAASLRHRATVLGLPLAGARVLDFGCGTGLLSERLASDVGRIVALDPSKAMIERLNTKIEAGLSNVEAIVGFLDDAMLRHPAFAAPFDLVVASSVCAFLDDYPGTVNRLAERLRPGGVFVQWDWEWRDEDEQPFGLTRKAVTDALSGAGLEVVFVDRGFEAAVDEMTMAPLMGVGRRPLP